jgi:hypothetical protein
MCIDLNYSKPKAAKAFGMPPAAVHPRSYDPTPAFFQRPTVADPLLTDRA